MTWMNDGKTVQRSSAAFWGIGCKAIVAVACAMAGAQQSVAQGLPTAGRLHNEQQRALPSTPPASGGAAAVDEPAAIANALPASGLRVLLHSVRFTGATDLAALNKLAAPSIGRTVGHADLLQIADVATRLLRSRGYLLAKAYLPNQDLTDGNLEIVVSEGRLQSGPDRIVIQGAARIDPGQLHAIVDAALPTGMPVTQGDLERAMMLVNDLPGLTARSTLEPGHAPGTSRLVVQAIEGSRVEGRAWVDNFGNRSTGAFRAGAQLQYNDPLKRGDSATLGMQKSAGSTMANFVYSVPVAPSGLRLNAGMSNLRYHVDQEVFHQLELRGGATSMQLSVSYPLLRTRERSLNLAFSYEHRRLDDDALGENLRARKLGSATVSLSGNRIDPWCDGEGFQGSIAWTAGRANLSGNETDKKLDGLTARASGGYQKLLLSANRLQNLGGAPGAEWSLYTGMTGQMTNGNLDSSEKFILGGPSGVRAYPVGEATGDEGALGTLELRRNINAGNDQKLQALAFVDAGHIRLHKRAWSDSVSNTGNTNHRNLASVGVGMNVWTEQWTLRAAIARTLGSNSGRSLAELDSDGRASRWRGWLQAIHAL